jgi:hypothetical protein
MVNSEWWMIKEEKPAGFSEINLKIFPKGISSLIINYSSLHIHYLILVSIIM